MKLGHGVTTCALFVAAWLSTFGWERSAHGQAYPTRQIQFIIDRAAGDATDLGGRAIAEQLAKILNVAVVPVNKSGAGGVEGTDFVAKARKDGYTILFAAAPPIVAIPVLAPKTTPYDPIRDLEPLGKAFTTPMVVAVKADSPFKTLKDLVDFAKKNPGKVRFSTAGKGTTTDLNVGVLTGHVKADITTVPYKGGTPAVTALLGGHVEGTSMSLGPTLPHLKAGTLRALVISSKAAQIPDAPTETEAGFPQLNLLESWSAAFTTAGTPDAVLKVLIPATEKAITSPEAQKAFAAVGSPYDFKRPDDMRKLIKSNLEMIREVAKQNNLIQE
jgi:tripartite-type tricarboxylate transporter receptor subunit TctC